MGYFLLYLSILFILGTIKINIVVDVRGKTIVNFYDVCKKDSGYVSRARPDRKNSVIAPYIYCINSRSW